AERCNGERELENPDGGRSEYADGRDAAQLLAAGVAFLRTARSGWFAGQSAPPGRRFDRLPRYLGLRGSPRQPLPTPWRLTVLWAQRTERATLRLSRLEVRSGRSLSRHAERIPGERIQAPHPPHRLSVRRTRRCHLGLYGARGKGATAA